MPEAIASIHATMKEVAVRDANDTTALAALLDSAKEPFVVRGLVSDWPMVEAGLVSAHEARAHLLKYARSLPFTVAIGRAGHGGRLFYDQNMAMNFREGKGQLPDIFAGFDKYEGQAEPPTAYLGSVDMKHYFDGLTDANPSPVSTREPTESIWIGTRTRIAAHNDFPDNLACCAVGRRRFTLFPPEQFANLYLGPIDNTPAGRAVSMVDFLAPDLERFPKFANALPQARYAELDPGDAVFIPSLWWHHVEGLAEFNVLVNYWWRDTPRWLGQPQDALNHAMLSIRDLPQDEKDVWRQLFDHYIFDNGPEVTDHIPEGSRGILDPLTPETANRIRAFLLRNLNR